MYPDISFSNGSSKRDLSAADANDRIRCFRVEVSSSGICEWSGNRISNTIPRDQIRQITLCGGTDVKSPFLRFFLGIILFPFGLIGSALKFLAVAGGGHPQLESGMFVLPLTPIALWFIAGIGFWLLAGIFRVRYFFQIETEKGPRKIYFGKSAHIDEIRRFIWNAKMSFGYVIDISILSPQIDME